MGILLRVNLSSKAISKQKMDDVLARDYIGGRGLNSRFLYYEVKPGADPLGPDNKIMFGISPCAGTTVPGSQRFTVSSKSPLTGFLGDSNSGGDFGAELKYAGYDMLIIEGESDTPVYLLIDDDKVELKAASHLWGKTTSETRRAIERETGDPEICLAVIGPAGENRVRFANIMSELGRAAGRTGMGAVLGSKRVKAVAVRGTHGVKVANNEILKELNAENYRLWRADAKAYQGWTAYGPTRAWASYAICGMLPTRNYKLGTFSKDMFQELVSNGLLVRQKACISCPLGCNHSYVVKTGPYAGTGGEGLELEQLADFGPRIGNENIALLLKGAALSNEYGVDVMDMSSLIAFAMECAENGILTATDAGGLKLEWGNAETILNLMKMTVYREGLGDTLAEGLKRAAEKIGKDSEKYAMHVKGQAMVMRNIRASKGWALSYAVSSRGPCHVRAWVPEGYAAGGAVAEGIWDPGALEFAGKRKNATNPLLEEGKAELVKWYEDLRAFQDSIDICRFSLYKGMVDSRNESLAGLLARYYNAVAGSSVTGDDGLTIGERIVNLERAFNIRQGLTRSDDSLPERMLKEPLPDGPARGQTVNLEPMIDRYYELRGWDNITGVPRRSKLAELGLEDVAGDLGVS